MPRFVDGGELLTDRRLSERGDRRIADYGERLIERRVADRRKPSWAPSHLLESLESRQMMSGSGAPAMHDGVLIVTGTNGPDVVRIAADPTSTAKMVVELNGKKYGFATKGLRGVRVDGRGGNDTIGVDPSAGMIKFPVTLIGGAGNDTLVGGAGNDSLEGDSGNDTLLGKEGRDSLVGGAGNDYVDGGTGDDAVNANTGTDTVVQASGKDKVTASGRKPVVIKRTQADPVTMPWDQKAPDGQQAIQENQIGDDAGGDDAGVGSGNGNTNAGGNGNDAHQPVQVADNRNEDNDDDDQVVVPPPVENPITVVTDDGGNDGGNAGTNTNTDSGSDTNTNGGTGTNGNPPAVNNPTGVQVDDLPQQPPASPLYDMTFYTGQPDLKQYGMLGITIRDISSFLGDDGSTVDEARTRAIARQVGDQGIPLVIDQEEWSMDVRTAPADKVAIVVGKMAQIVDLLHAERPNLKVGYYGALPLRDYWTPVLYATYAKSDPAYAQAVWKPKYDAWKAANDVLKPVGDRVDFVCPSLYTFYNDPANWAVYAQANIAEAKRYGKPVLPFLWMKYHGSNPVDGGHFIANDFWRQEIELTRSASDGVIIWGGFGEQWNSNDGWWGVVQNVLNPGQAPGAQGIAA